MSSRYSLSRLINAQGTPSELLCRFSDALFFHVDANARVAYRNTGLIEPMKWAWLSTSVGNDPALVSDPVRCSSRRTLLKLESSSVKLDRGERAGGLV